MWGGGVEVGVCECGGGVEVGVYECGEEWRWECVSVGGRSRGGSVLSVLKAWVGLFLVKIDMLNCWLHFSNTQQCVGTIYILWIEVCLVIKKKVATFWKTAHVSKRTANGKPHPAITWAQKAQHLDITNRGLSGCIINYSLSSNFLPGRIA